MMNKKNTNDKAGFSWPGYFLRTMLPRFLGIGCLFLLYGILALNVEEARYLEILLYFGQAAVFCCLLLTLGIPLICFARDVRHFLRRFRTKDSDGETNAGGSSEEDNGAQETVRGRNEKFGGRPVGGSEYNQKSLSKYPTVNMESVIPPSVHDRKLTAQDGGDDQVQGQGQKVG